MENHPIPQDVTGFQFRLIGSMTVKQFAYLATSAVLAFGIYSLPINTLIKVVLIPIVGGIGPALAFLPVEGRPMDQMLSHFAHALLRPNQYLFIKEGGKLPLSLIELHGIRQSTAEQLEARKAQESKTLQREEKLNLYLQQIHHTTEADKREDAFVQNVLSDKPTPLTQPVSAPTPNAAQTPPVIQVSSPPPPVVDQNTSQQVVDVQKQEQELEKELQVAKTQEAQSHSPQEAQSAHGKAESINQQLSELLKQKEALEKQLASLSQNQTQTASPTPAQAQVAGATIIAKDMAGTQGLPSLPLEPNLVSGIVKDPRGNVLSNLLVEIKDKDGNPVRAFKTNLKGQFAAATKLPNGNYTILFEDPKGESQFDVIAITADGNVIPPILVTSHDAREALRQQLFG